MLPFIGSALVGAWLVARTKPQSRVERKALIGPVSGATYQVEDFPASGVMVVRSPSRDAVATLVRRAREDGTSRLEWVSGQGHPGWLAAMQKDLCPKPAEKDRGSRGKQSNNPSSED